MNARVVTWGGLSIAAAALIALVMLTTSPPRAPSPANTQTQTSAGATSAETKAAPGPPPKTSAVATSTAGPKATEASSAPSAAADPELDDSWKLLAGNAPPGARDPFEDTGTGEPIGKLLGKTGAIRYGVMRKNTKITNEAAVAEIVRRAAMDIDKLDRGRTDQPHKRLPEYETILRALRADLRPHMDGRVMIAGQGWAIASEAGEQAEAAARDAGRE